MVKDAVAKGMQAMPSQLHVMQHQWYSGEMYFATPDKPDWQVSFVDKRVRQAWSTSS